MESASAPRATLRQIAEAAQVSATTVSLALRNHPRIPSSTRLKIQALGRQLGYFPNPSVAALMTQVRAGNSVSYRETLAWLNPFDHADPYGNKNLPALAYSQKLWEGAVLRAGQLGYALDTFWLRAPNMTGRRMSAVLGARGVRGVLIPPLPQPYGHLSLNWPEFSVTALSYTMARPQFHRVVPDHHHNIQTILRRLRHRGYQRIGLLLPPRHDERLENRFRSTFCFHQQNVPIRHRLPILICPEKALKTTCAAWLRKYRPDVVITLGHFRDLRKIDLGDPAYSRNLGIVLIGCGAPRDRTFTVMDENPLRIAASAVDHLAGQLSRNERGIPDCPETVLIKGAWIEGQTLAPCGVALQECSADLQACMPRCRDTTSN